MVKRAFLFVILGALTGAMIGSLSVGVFVQDADNLSERAAILWGILGVIHGLVLFFSSLGETPIIEDTRRGNFVASSLADGFDYRHFGHRIPYITAISGLVIAFLVSSLLVQGSDTEVTSIGIRLLASFALSFIWTGILMIANIVIVSKIALR